MGLLRLRSRPDKRQRQSRINDTEEGDFSHLLSFFDTLSMKMPRFMDRTLKRQLPSIKLHVFVDRDWRWQYVVVERCSENIAAAGMRPFLLPQAAALQKSAGPWKAVKHRIIRSLISQFRNVFMVRHTTLLLKKGISYIIPILTITQP